MLWGTRGWYGPTIGMDLGAGIGILISLCICFVMFSKLIKQKNY